MGSSSGERGLRAVGRVVQRGASAWRTATRRSVAASSHSPEPAKKRQAEVSRVSGVGGEASSRKKVRSSGDNRNSDPESPRAKNPRRVSATAGGCGLVMPWAEPNGSTAKVVASIRARPPSIISQSCLPRVCRPETAWTSRTPVAGSMRLSPGRKLHRRPAVGGRLVSLKGWVEIHKRSPAVASAWM